ncbi:hypothetical protein NKH52_28390 [Mesorhizobium sp. M1066]|uniref:hypothetical protein n=1 Tax=unclassified Mesorhizobium TaxID=325217 RepID=UPI003335EDDB
MANTPSKDHSISDKEALKIAEQTDVSARQAKEHGKAKGEQEARDLFTAGCAVLLLTDLRSRSVRMHCACALHLA